MYSTCWFYFRIYTLIKTHILATYIHVNIMCVRHLHSICRFCFSYLYLSHNPYSSRVYICKWNVRLSFVFHSPILYLYIIKPPPRTAFYERIYYRWNNNNYAPILRSRRTSRRHLSSDHGGIVNGVSTRVGFQKMAVTYSRQRTLYSVTCGGKINRCFLTYFTVVLFYRNDPSLTLKPP